MTEIFPLCRRRTGKGGDEHEKHLFGGMAGHERLHVLPFYGVDKRRAKRGAWRIPEKTLLLCTWLLGGVGALIGMRVFHHKTKHRLFTISAPIAAAISIVAALCGLMM